MGPGNEDQVRCTPAETGLAARVRQLAAENVHGVKVQPGVQEPLVTAPASAWAIHLVFEKALPASGAPMDNVWTEPDRDYPADTDLMIQRGQFTDRIRMTPADQDKIRAALGITPAQVREFLAGLLDAREQSEEEKTFFERVIEMLKGEG